MNGYHVKVEGLFDDEIIYIRTGLEFEVFEFYMKEMFRNKSVFCVSNYNKPYIYERQNIMCLSYWFEVPFDVYCNNARHRDIFLELFSAWWCRGLLALSEEERKRLMQ